MITGRRSATNVGYGAATYARFDPEKLADLTLPPPARRMTCPQASAVLDYCLILPSAPSATTSIHCTRWRPYVGAFTLAIPMREVPDAYPIRQARRAEARPEGPRSGREIE